MVAEIGSGYQSDLDPKNRLSAEALQSIISQLEKYGARPAKEAHGAIRQFDSGILYSVTKPVESSQIEYANEAQLDEAQNRSVEKATNAAIATGSSEITKSKKSGNGEEMISGLNTEIEVRGNPRAGKKKKLMSVTVDESASPDAKI